MDTLDKGNKQTATKPFALGRPRSPSLSPVQIRLGIEDHPEVTPLKKDLMVLFEKPIKVVSPLPPTPKRRKLHSSVENEEKTKPLDTATHEQGTGT